MAELEIVGGIKENFTMIPNEIARAKDVTPRALKVYVYLRSHTAGFNVNVRGIATNLGMGKNSVNDAVRELEELGYIERVWVTPDGTNLRSGIKYRVFETRCTQNEDTGVPNFGNPTLGTPKTGTHKEDQSFKKTNSLKKINNPHKKFGERFESFYEEYPRHVGKNEAWKRWQQQLEKTDEDSLIKAAKNFAIEHERQETPKQFIPHPSTFLNQERWRDYLDEPKESQSVSIGVFDDGSF